MNRKYLMRIAIIISALLLTQISFVSSHAASSTNVALENDLYRDMEFWATEGLIESQLSSIKPLARSEVGKQILAALDKCDAMENKSATCINIQEHYAKLFAAEIAETRSPRNTVSTFVKPVEAFSVSYNYLNGPFPIYNNEGIQYGEGSNAMIQLQSQARLWEVFSFYAEPILMYNQHFYQTEDGSNADVRLHKGYAKLTLWNVDLQVGRDSLWWGPGYHSALLMSDNSQPFDMIKLSNPEPVLLPWIFSFLGPAQFNLIFSQLNDVRTGSEANPFLYGLRFDIKPHPFLELGVSQLVMFGGSGHRDLSLNDIITILYSNNVQPRGSATDRKQEVAIDIALTIPNIKKYVLLIDGIKFYCEVGADDTGYPPDKRAYLAGFALYKPFGQERAVFRGEYAILSPYGVPDAWYFSNPNYPMVYSGQIFGDHIGPDAEDIFIEWSQNFEKLSYKLSFDRIRSGIQMENYPQFDFTYSGEIGYQIEPNTKITLKYAYENIINVGNVQNYNQRNQFLGVAYAIYF
jgi:hypothetical protein